MSNYHITRHEAGWVTLKENSQRVSGYFETQRQAENSAKGFLAKSGGGEVKIHGPDGKIRDSDTVKPAHDPFPPRDSKH